MDFDDRVEYAFAEEAQAWSNRFQQLQKSSRLTTWVSSFRDGKACEVSGNDFGSFNWSVKVRFEDASCWMVRFSVPGRAIQGDEKTRAEVAAMSYVAAKTTIPVPVVRAWGTAADNSLGLGPFIMMDFVQGENLGKILEVLPRPASGVMMRSDVEPQKMGFVYRQVADMLLQLSKLDFDCIGALTVDGRAGSRPLSLRLQEIEAHSGVVMSEDISQTYLSTTEYFQEIAEQELRHLGDQPNSCDDLEDARAKYIQRFKFRSLVSHFVDKEYDRGPFKLICDDMRFGNMLVEPESLKIVAVLDWEWAYCAPYQMFYSPPSWLIMRRPMRWDSDFALFTKQYQEQFDIFTKVLEEEEEKQSPQTSGPADVNRLSYLMKKAMKDGKFWAHELLHACFESGDNVAWTALRKLVPDVGSEQIPEEDVKAFAMEKMKQLETYQREWATQKADIDEQKAKEAAELQRKKEELEKVFGPFESWEILHDEDLELEHEQ